MSGSRVLKLNYSLSDAVRAANSLSPLKGRHWEGRDVFPVLGTRLWFLLWFQNSRPLTQWPHIHCYYRGGRTEWEMVKFKEMRQPEHGRSYYCNVFKRRCKRKMVHECMYLSLSSFLLELFLPTLPFVPSSPTIASSSPSHPPTPAPMASSCSSWRIFEIHINWNMWQKKRFPLLLLFSLQWRPSLCFPCRPCVVGLSHTNPYVCAV